MIIGIVGTLGAGKSTVAEYLAKKHRFAYLSVHNFIAAEVVRRGKLASHEAIVQVADELRREHSPTWLIEQLLDQATAQTHAFNQKDAVIESIRTVAEANALRGRGAVLWAVEAEAPLRFERTRLHTSQNVSLEKFTADENEEMHSESPNEPNLAGVMAAAEAHLTNNGTKDELYAQVERALRGQGAPSQ